MKFYVQLLTALTEARQSERGATMAEYGLMIALVAVVAAVGAALLGTALSTLFSTLSTQFN